MQDAYSSGGWTTASSQDEDTEVNNERLKVLFSRSDAAFQALLKEPDSAQLHRAYEAAQRELQAFIAASRRTLDKRPSPRQN